MSEIFCRYVVEVGKICELRGGGVTVFRYLCYLEVNIWGNLSKLKSLMSVILSDVRSCDVTRKQRFQAGTKTTVKIGERKVKENLIFTSEFGFVLRHWPCAQLPGDERLKKKQHAKRMSSALINTNWWLQCFLFLHLTAYGNLHFVFSAVLANNHNYHKAELLRCDLSPPRVAAVQFKYLVHKHRDPCEEQRCEIIMNVPAAIALKCQLEGGETSRKASSE